MPPWSVALAVGVYLFAFRIYGVEDNFAFAGEQVRDWSVAQRSFANLPWIGPRSVTSGLDIGPVYYRFLWLARVVLGPFADNLPHAGAWAIAALQSVADAALLLALWRVLGSGWLAAAIVIAAGSSTGDVALSSTIWNPPVAVAFVKLASAACIWSTPLTRGAGMCALGFAALGVQAHFSALVVAVPVTIAALWSLWTARGLRGMLPAIAVGVLLAMTWLVPYAARRSDLANPTVPGQQTGAVPSLFAAAADPLHRLRVHGSTDAVASALEFLLGRPYRTPWLRWVLLGEGLILIVALRHAALTAVSAAAIVTAIAVFSLWQGNFGEFYWFLVIGPAAAICLIAPIALTRGRLRVTLTAGVVAVVTLIQPARASEAWHTWRTPQYGVLVAGARTIVARGEDVREIHLGFEVPPGADVYFLHALLGGRLDGSGPVVRIESTGEVTYLPD